MTFRYRDEEHHRRYSSDEDDEDDDGYAKSSGLGVGVPPPPPPPPASSGGGGGGSGGGGGADIGYGSKAGAAIASGGDTSSDQIYARAVEAWSKRFAEEISMDEDEQFKILRTSMSGWWYAQSMSSGVDGLVPFTKLEIVRGVYADYGGLSLHEYEHIERTVFAWDIENVTQIIFQKNRMTADEQHTLLHALRRLYMLMSRRQDDSTYFLRSGGLDQLLHLLAKTWDIGQRYFIVRNIAFLSVAPAILRFNAKACVAAAVVSAMQECMELPSFVACCCDAVSNACYENDVQRALAADPDSGTFEALMHALREHLVTFGVQNCGKN